MNPIYLFFILVLANLAGQLIGNGIKRYIGRRGNNRGSQVELSRRKFIESLKNSENIDESQKTMLDVLFDKYDPEPTLMSKVKEKYHELTDEPGEYMPDMTEKEFEDYEHKKVSGWDKLYSKLPKIKKDDDGV